MNTRDTLSPQNCFKSLFILSFFAFRPVFLQLGKGSKGGRYVSPFSNALPALAELSDPVVRRIGDVTVAHHYRCTWNRWLELLAGEGFLKLLRLLCDDRYEKLIRRRRRRNLRLLFRGHTKLRLRNFANWFSFCAWSAAFWSFCTSLMHFLSLYCDFFC